MNSSTNEILSLFSGLYLRLNQLNCFTETLYLNEIPDIDNSEIDKIMREAITFDPVQVIKAIDYALLRIKALQERGIKLLENVKILRNDVFNLDYDLSDHEREQAKNDYFKIIENELAIYSDKLLSLKSTLLSNTESTDEDSLKYQLTRAKELPSRMLALSIEQLALLFHYLRMFKVVPNERVLPNSKLAISISLFSGWSVKNLTSDNGFGKIDFIKEDRIGKNNLVELKSLLEKILEQINADIQANSR